MHIFPPLSKKCLNQLLEYISAFKQGLNHFQRVQREILAL